MRRWGFAAAFLIALLMAAPAPRRRSSPGSTGRSSFIGSSDAQISVDVYSIQADGTRHSPPHRETYLGDTDPLVGRRTKSRFRASRRHRTATMIVYVDYQSTATVDQI